MQQAVNESVLNQVTNDGVRREAAFILRERQFLASARHPETRRLSLRLIRQAQAYIARSADEVIARGVAA